MRKLLFILFLQCSFWVDAQESISILGQQFLTNILQRKDVSEHIQRYKSLTEKELLGLETKEQKLSFWINTYNGFIQYFLLENPDLYKDKNAFFSEPRMRIAGQVLSFDDIEHGILRNSRVKLSLGYLKKWFVSRFERKHRNTQIDYRIHFALNCGAASCPVTRVYQENNIKQQLEHATAAYLRKTTQVKGNEIKVTPLMSWFRGDFGSKKKRKSILKKYTAIKQAKGMKITYLPYDWSLDLQNFKLP